MQDCIFCKIVAGDIPSKMIYEDDDVYAFEDVTPQAPSHTLIIPKKHLETLLEIGDEHRDLMGSIILAATRIARKLGIAEKGYRIVTNCNKEGGQVVFHIHFHLLGGRQMKWPPG